MKHNTSRMGRRLAILAVLVLLGTTVVATLPGASARHTCYEPEPPHPSLEYLVHKVVDACASHTNLDGCKEDGAAAGVEHGSTKVCVWV